MRCNLTEAEQKAALEVPFRCTGEEQEFIERCFIGYLFFEHEADENGRLGVTTECTRCGRKVWWTEREWKRFKQENDVKARSNLLCPDCGCGVTLYPRGKLRNGKALDEYRQVVLLRAIDGALRAVALGVWKHHGRWESDDAECCVKAAYYFAQGKCQKWRREWAWSEEERQYTPRLVAQKTMTEPFAKCDSWICRRIGDYAIHGVDQIAASPLRYCAAEQFFKLDGDDPRENTEGLLTYLGLWTRYPRIEQLAKAGCEKIINDAIQGSMNSRALNWRAKTMYCLGRYYNDALLGIETNFSTYPVKLLALMGYPKLYVREVEDDYTGRIKQAYGFQTNRTTRPVILSELIRILRESMASINDRDTLLEMFTFVRREKDLQGEAESGAHDDCVLALAIAHYIRPQQTMEVTRPRGERVRWSQDLWDDYNKATPAEREAMIRLWGRPE